MDTVTGALAKARYNISEKTEEVIKPTSDLVKIQTACLPNKSVKC